MTILLTFFFYFIIYSFIGWIIEGLFNLFKEGQFIKPNFLKLPLKPMYGFASTLLVILASPLPLWLVLLLCFIVPSLVEYLSAYLLDTYLGLHYWNYEHKPFQARGYICLEFSCYWFFLSLLLILFVHPYIVSLYILLFKPWTFIAPFIFLIIVYDFITTFSKNRQHYKNSLT